MDSIKVPTEAQEQINLVKYMKFKGLKYTYIPNDTFTKSWAIKMKNKRLGVCAGFPDIVVIVNNHLLFIELKRTKGGVVSEFQRSWIQSLNKCLNVEARICKGCVEAIAFIEQVENM